MGRLRPMHNLRAILQSTHYPIVDMTNTKIREGMRNLGFADFWDYWFDSQNITKLDPAYIARACYSFSDIVDIGQRVPAPKMIKLTIMLSEDMIDKLKGYMARKLLLKKVYGNIAEVVEEALIDYLKRNETEYSRNKHPDFKA